MKKVIYKYTLNAYPTQHYLPVGAKFLSVQNQNETPQMCFVVDPEEQKTEQRNFVAHAIGEVFYDNQATDYLGTFQLDGGRLVFHIFELLS